MTDLDLLAQLIDDIARDMRSEIEPLPLEDVSWSPGTQANSIGVSLWHMARGMDFLAVQVLQGKPVDDELWHTLGWCEKTGYNPRGIGYGGWGVVTGYSWEEVLAIPALSARELMEYLDQAAGAVSTQVRLLTPESAHQAVPELMKGRLTYYQWVKEFYKGFQAHVGEMMAIKAMIARWQS